MRFRGSLPGITGARGECMGGQTSSSELLQCAAKHFGILGVASCY